MKRRLISLVGILVLVMMLLPTATSIPAMATPDTLTLQPNGAGDYVVCTDYYHDNDGDGWGTGVPECLESPPAYPHATQGGDCDDNDAAINPDAAEVCDGQDNDCDTLVDGDDADFVPLQIQLAMILDGSGSIDEVEEWDFMIEGLAAAVEDSQCVPQDGTVELTVIQFGDGQAQLEIGPVVITAANAGAVAAQIQGIGQIGGWTPMACGIYLAADTLAASPCFSTDLKQVINLVTDGEPNRCCDGYTSSACPQGEDAFDSAEAAREYAITTLGMTEGQDEIDAEFIGNADGASSWLRDSIAYPQPGYYAPEFNGGGWVRVIANVDDFASTICEKFTVIVCDDDNPCTIDTYDGEQCVFTPIETETICDDEIDNDCDGYIDCDDEEDCACSTCRINVQTDPMTHATFYIYDITAGDGTYGPTDPGWISNGDYLESYNDYIPCGHCYQVWVTKPGIFYTVKKSGLSGQAGPAHDNWCCEYAPVAYGCTTSGTYNIHFEAGAGCPEEECLTLETQTIISDEDTEVTDGNTGGPYPYPAVPAWVHSNWTTDLDYAFLSGAQWIWETEYVVHPQAGDVVTFERTVTIPSDATSIVGAIYITCDNGYEVWLNGSFVGSAQVHNYDGTDWQVSPLTEDWVNSSGWQSVESYNISDPLLAPGENTFVFECANEQMEGGTTSSNPGGLIFEIQIAYCTSTCDDGIDCTIDSCDPKTGECIHTPVDAYCDDGLWCNGAEYCDEELGCMDGTPPNCNDGVACTDDSCDEDNDQCVNTPNDGNCDDGLWCNGAEYCDEELGCMDGTPPDCDDDVACTDDSCDEDNDQCVNTPNDGNCDDGAWCNGAEYCDEELGCMDGTPPNCNDGVACTDDSCDEDNDQCVNTPNDGNCDDGAWCNGAEYCDEELGCMDGTPVDCDDGNACTQDWCNEENDTCQHRNICVTGGGPTDTACYLWVDMLGEIYRVEMKCCPNESIEYHKCLDPDELHFIEIEEDMEIICGDCAGACTDDPKDCTDCQMCRAFPKVIVMSLAEESPDPPDGTVVVGSVYYDFTGYKDTKRLIECEIATFFYPEISILVSFDPETIPPGGFDPYLAWYDAELGVWNPLPSDPDKDKLAGVGQVTGLTNTFASTFAVLVNVPAPEPTPVPEPVVPEPAHFVVSDLSITPKESKTGETVTISVNVTNDGEEEGTYLVELMINGQIAKDAEVTLGAGQSEEVTFAVSAAEPGQYEVVVSGLSGEFTVVGAINWWLWGSIIAAVILFAAWLFWYRRRRMRAEPAS